MASADINTTQKLYNSSEKNFSSTGINMMLLKNPTAVELITQNVLSTNPLFRDIHCPVESCNNRVL